MIKYGAVMVLAVAAVFFAAGVLYAGVQPNKEMQALMDSYLAAAMKADPGFKGFSAEEGKAFFNAKRMHSANKEERGCTTCHTTNPANKGKTTVGKVIEPMAPSINKERFTDPAKVEKWFKRNCSWVLERECTPKEKGNYITYMLSI
ncbi:MAG: DUF1924 domain-containing protein [Deltaproteobacteria bacterium]|nr:DUF1924 domain-containing protein [Deltaproteobacteria bacterium]